MLRALSAREKFTLGCLGMPIQIADMVLHGKDKDGDYLVNLKTGESYGIEIDLRGFLRGCPYYFSPRL